MKLAIFFPFSLLLLFTGLLQAQDNARFILAGSLYDSQKNQIVQNRIIHIQNNKIVNVGKDMQIPDNAEIIDLSEYTVLPGLIDAHTHVLFDQELEDDFSEHSINTLVLQSEALRSLRAVKRARSYLDVGITSIKDLGNSGPFLDVALRDAINEASVEGPRIYAAGKILSSVGGQVYGVTEEHQSIIDREYRVIRNSDDAVNAVREHLNQGVDLIKICADNLPNIGRLTVPEMQAIVQTAHSYGLTVTAHSVSDSSARDAIKAGVDGIEHGFFLTDSTLSIMAENRVFLVPTENSQAYMEEHYRPESAEPGEPTWIDNYMRGMQERLKKAIDKGVTIVAGSDNYTNIGVSRGKSSQDMFRAYFEAGMKPLDILQSATYLSAKALQKENEIGSLKPGSFADIIAVKGHIEQDFLNTIKNMIFVMKDGKIYLDRSHDFSPVVMD